MKYSLKFKNNANRVVERFQNPMAEKKIVGRIFSALWLAVFLERGIGTWGTSRLSSPCARSSSIMFIHFLKKVARLLQPNISIVQPNIYNKTCLTQQTYFNHNNH